MFVACNYINIYNFIQNLKFAFIIFIILYSVLNLCVELPEDDVTPKHVGVISDCMYRTYIKIAILGAKKEKFNWIKMHGINNVKISKLCFKRIGLKISENLL